MDDQPQRRPGDAFAFEATWRDYLPIALSNLALTIVTLGIYRFWAKARERRFLWSRTRFIDEPLEWSGTGREMFVGFLVVMLIAAPALLAINLVSQTLIARGRLGAGTGVLLASYALILYLYGLARFRGLRYRLSRSWWHGIRGGSDDRGLGYALSTLWKTPAGSIALGLLVPWSMTSLWRERWNAMSFGGERFEATVTTHGLMRRWLLVLASPFLMVFLLTLIAVSMFAGGVGMDARTAGGIVAGIVVILAIYPVVGLAYLVFYAKFIRRAIGDLRLGPVEFEFTAGSRDWIRLLLGDIGLVVVTLGVGIAFLGYRHWAFLIRHLGAIGEIDLARLTQSRTHAPREAEGFADAFDIGAV